MESNEVARHIIRTSMALWHGSVGLANLNLGGTNSRPDHSRKLDQITKSSYHFDPLSDLPVCFIYLGKKGLFC